MENLEIQKPFSNIDKNAMVFFKPSSNMDKECFNDIVLYENNFSQHGISDDKFVFHTPNLYYENPLVLIKELSDICKEYSINGVISITYKCRPLNNLKTVIENQNQNINDSDLKVEMFRVARSTKGFHFKVKYKKLSYEIDHYELCSDYEALLSIYNVHGYHSSKVDRFNEILIEKGGIEYKEKLNNKFFASLK